MPNTAGTTIRTPRSRPAASSSVVPTRTTRRASMPQVPGSPGAGCGLGRVPGERDGRAGGLIVVVRRPVQRHAELVAVLGAAGEAAEARDGVTRRAHLGERAGVLVDVV